MENQVKTYNTSEMWHINLNRYKESDNGRMGKSAELTLRQILTPNSRRNLNQVEGYGKYYHDFTVKISAKDELNKLRLQQKNFEIKTVCGEITNLSDETVEEILEVNGKVTMDDIAFNIVTINYQYCNFIMYAPILDINTNILTQFYVCDCQPFLNYMYDNKGLRTKTKSNKSDICVSIQSFYAETRPTASKKLEAIIWDYILNYPTAEIFFKERLNKLYNNQI